MGSRGHSACVAGVHAPAFVERCAVETRSSSVRAGRVAGVHAPAFVERCAVEVERFAERLVSPGFMPRPSLSAGCVGRPGNSPFVSPGFMPRPSLSDGNPRDTSSRATRVAGVHAPAFVERSLQSNAFLVVERVSPGFMPRPSLSVTRTPSMQHTQCRQAVSPGFMPRPSLSVEVIPTDP